MLKNWQTHQYSSNVKEGRESNAQSTGLNANIHVCSIVTVIGLTEASMVTNMHNDALYAVHKGILEVQKRVRVRRRQRRRVTSGGRHLCSRVEVRRRRGPETRYRLAPVARAHMSQWAVPCQNRNIEGIFTQPTSYQAQNKFRW